MEEFHLEGHPHVALCDLLKLLGWTDSGANAKGVVADGLVSVDGQVVHIPTHGDRSITFMPIT